MNALDLAEAPKVHGYRTAIMVLRDLATLIEQHPEIDQPSVSFSSGVSSWSNVVSFHAWEYGIKKPNDFYSLSCDERAALEKKLETETVVRKINTIVEAFSGVTEWVPNDPSAEGATSHDRDYYVITGMWGDITIKVMAHRKVLGEEVQVVYAGPQVTMQDGTLHALRQTMTIWKPNPDLSPRIMDPARMLETASAGPALQELTATEIVEEF